MSLPANLLTATQADVESFVSEQAVEGQHLDFKRDLPSTWGSSAKHEFLADVTAFANAGGGDLVFGVDENGSAQASSVVTQVPGNIDQEVLRMQDMLLHIAEPRMPGVQVHPIPVQVAGVTGHVIVVRVPQSWAGPHRVNTNNHFFIRDGGRKRQLDIPEIRGLMLRSESQAKAVRDFRTERLGRLLAGEGPVKLVDAPLVVVHFIPAQAALGSVLVDPASYYNQRLLPLLGSTGGQPRISLDGYLTVAVWKQVGADEYALLFRNGFFEATIALTNKTDSGRVWLTSGAFERNLIQLLTGFRAELQRLDVALDTTVMLSVLRAREVRLGVRNSSSYLEDHQAMFDRHVVALPDVLAKGTDAPDLALKPVFDLLWQAAGSEGSQHYAENGTRLPTR